ncbi:MAG: glycosyltransferase family 4 protein [Anaerolineae bacterium]|nr:glycosyltransferase family 4 protein [Anaerolineae bacterium]
MTQLLYIANVRLPTEKAHGLQIMQNCEAFADSGAEVRLWTAHRVNTPALRDITDIWAHYGVKRNFTRRTVPCIDLIGLVPERADWLAKLIFHLQQTTFVLVALIGALFQQADIYYSREAITLFVLSLIKPKHTLAYEVHTMAGGRSGGWLRRQTLRRCGTIIPVTKRLGEDLVKLGADPARVLVAHDGIRQARFAQLPTQTEARTAVNWPQDAFIVGYVGRLHTMALDKGVSTLIEALKRVDGAVLALVGGPDDMAEILKQQWQNAGLNSNCFINAGQVTPERVPTYLSALDVCTMPFPWTEHFAYYASPMKLFEYMASGRAIVASDLPSTAEVVTNDESALLYPPGDVDALAAAIIRLRDDPALRSRLGNNAREQVMSHYTWDARARAILDKVTRRA